MTRRNKEKEYENNSRNSSIRNEYSTNNEKVPSISYFTLYRYTSKCDIVCITTAVSASVISGLTIPFSISLVASAFHSMIDYAKKGSNATDVDEKFLHKMHTFGAQYSCIGVILFITGYLASSLMNISAINQVIRIRKIYLRSVLNQDLSHFDLERTRNFASRMAEDLVKLEEGIGYKVTNFIDNLTTALACIIMAMMKGWKLALLCMTTAPMTFTLVGLAGWIANRQYKKQAIQTSRANSIAEEVLSSIRTVYAFSGQQKEIDRYSKPLALARRIIIRKELFTGLSNGALFLCIFCSYALSFYFGIYLIVKDPQNYNPDVMFSVFFGIMTGLGNFGIAAPLVASFGSATGAGAQIFHIIDNIPTINPLLGRGLKPTTIQGNIEFDHVFFHYPSRTDVPILKGVSFSVRRGQSVALVGHSGAGKSTIVQLVTRFYDVVDGTVRIDGVDIRMLSVVWLRRQIGMVGQEAVLFNTSVHENIRFGCEEATDAQVEHAARQANAHEFIMQLPKGYKTQVGEYGTSLSGGQKQRIAIARALVRNPRILLLDEATSALDPRSEAKVQQALIKAAEGRTTIIVAHRLSTVRNASVIHVFKYGEIVESGSHEELVSRKGYYFNMLAMQERITEVVDDKVSERLKREKSPTSDVLDATKITEEAISPTMSSIKDMKTRKYKLPFWKVLKMSSPEWKTIAVGSLCSVVNGFAMPLFVLVFGQWFGSMSSNDPVQLMINAKTVALICVGIGAVIGTTHTIEGFSFGRAGAYLSERLRVCMFVHLLRQQIAFFDEHVNSTGALCARLSTEAYHVQGATGRRVGMLLQGVGSIGLALILALVHEWRVALIALSFLPLITTVVYYQGKFTAAESLGTAKTIESSTGVAVEAISNIKTVSALGLEKKFVDKYSNLLDSAVSTAKSSAHFRGVVTGMSRSMFNFMNSATMVYGGHLIVSEHIPCQNILVTTQSLQMAAGHTQNAFAYAPEFEKGMMAASNIHRLLKTQPTIVDPKTPLAVGFKSSGAASLERVEFMYPTRPNVSVLQGLDLEIPKGKKVALVGSSGCGKSTVMQLLQRHYDADAGVVALDSFPLQRLLIKDVRASFGLVSQEPVLFDRSISENIAYGDNSRILDEHEIMEAAKLAHIHDFILSLPEGYDTNIGTKGTQLSGGQKQRVAIARALIRHPKILLLDEATSALDPASEMVVQTALDMAIKGRTSVTITHRLSTIRDADVICVLAGGRVVERGTHAQLMELKGQYYSLQNTIV